MTYHLTHIVEFETPVTERVRIEMHRKDIIPDEVTPLQLSSLTREVLSGGGDGADTILTTQLNFTLWLREDSGAEWDDFIVSFHDEWKIILITDGQIEFVGFLTPREGTSSLIGIRQDIKLTATDNLGLLKKPKLKKYDGSEFR